MVGGDPLRVGDADRAARDLQDAPRRVAQLEDVAGRALDGEVLVQRADEGLVRLEDHPVVGEFRDRAAGRLRQQPRAAPAAHHAVHLVAMQQRRAPAPSRAEAVGGHGDHGIEIAARESAIGRSAADQVEERGLVVLGARTLRDHLLREHVERRVVLDDGVELAAADRAEQRRAFDQIVARHREQAALRRARHRVSRSSDPLQQGRDPVRRSDLADQIDVADVDARARATRSRPAP